MTCFLHKSRKLSGIGFDISVFFTVLSYFHVLISKFSYTPYGIGISLLILTFDVCVAFSEKLCRAEGVTSTSDLLANAIHELGLDDETHRVWRICIMFLWLSLCA